jgi:cell division protein FtsB
MRVNIEIKKYKTWFVISLVFFMLCLLGRVYCSNRLVVKNGDLKYLYNKKVELEKQISSLKYEESRLSSLGYLESRARELGFVPMNDSLMSLNLDAPVPVAVLPVQ